MEWRPIETAPCDVPVMCGRWSGSEDRVVWDTFATVAWDGFLWGLFRFKAYGAMMFTHWKPLPLTAPNERM